MSPRLARILGVVAVLLHPSFSVGLGWGADGRALESESLGSGPSRTARAGSEATDAEGVRTVLELLGAEARFATGVDTLPAAGEVALARLVERLKRHGELLSIRVVGHTDSLGPLAYNRRLSARRAAHVGAFIARRYPSVPMVSAGAGESTPLASNATAAGRARNRRVEIHVVAKIGARR